MAKHSTRTKFTARSIEARIKTPHASRVDYSDTLTPGLQIRIGPRTASWYYLRRVDGTLHRLRLGKFTELSLSEARSKAGEIESAIARGSHPKTHVARKRGEVSAARDLDHARLMQQVAKKWRQVHYPGVGAKSREMYEAHLRTIEAEFSGRDISMISRGELVRFLDAVKASTASGVGANHAASTLRQLFRFAEERLDLESNPAATLRNPVRRPPRSRVLTEAEIRIVWSACQQAGYPYGHLLRFALCTGQRVGECGAIRRSDLDTRGDYWSNSQNKSSRRIDIFLAPLAREILEECPIFDKTGYFFSASGGKFGIRSDTLSKALGIHIYPRVEAAAMATGETPISNHWTAHDLRRTVRSGLTGWCGISPDTAERVLNHAIGGIRSHYDYADYRPHVAKALSAWDSHLREILTASTS